MPQPTPSDVHVNAPLTNISLAYLQDLNDFVSTKVFPIVPVKKQSDRYFRYEPDNWFRTEAKPRGLSQESAGSGFEIDNTPSYNCVVKALHKDIDDQLRANADVPLNPDRDSTVFVTHGMALRREKDWAADFFTTGLWTGSSTGTDIVPGTLWDVAGSTPITDIRTEIAAMKKKTGIRPNKLVLAEDAWTKIQDNADFLSRINVSSTRIVTRELLASVLELDEVLIAGAVENTAAEGATAAMDWVMGKDALLVHAAPRPSIMVPSAGYVFSWTGFLGATKEGTRMKRFRMDSISSDRIEGEMANDMKLVASDLGVFFNNVIS